MPLWALTFGDLMTQILCFFVLLLSFSTTSLESYKQAASSIKKALGILEDIPMILDIDTGTALKIETSSQFENLSQRLKGILNVGGEEIQGIHIETHEDRLIIRLSDKVLFEPGKFEISQAGKDFLNKVIRVLHDHDGDILVAGHTDNTPINTPLIPNNWVLSALRASSVANYLIKPDNMATGISPYRLSITGFADTRPIDTNETEEGRTRNRRVEIVVLPKDFTDSLNSELIKKKKFTPLPPLFIN